MRLRSLLISMLLLCGAGESCFGQFNGAIQGTVLDQSQSVVPEASVRVVSVSTDVVREAITSADGLYRVLSLAPGEYKVIVEKTGFQSVERDSVTLALNDSVQQFDCRR